MRMCLSLGAALWFAAAASWAVDWKSLKPAGYVSDFARVVDSASRARLESYAAEVERVTGAHIALVTIPSLEGEPLEDVASSLARGWGIENEKNGGVLLLLAMADRRSRLEIGEGLKPVLPADLASKVRWEMSPALRAHHYGEAMMAAAETLGGAIAQARHVPLTARLPRRLRPTMGNTFVWIFALFLFGELLVLAAVLFAYPAILRRAMGAQTGGGFGAFDSGDSFGGFGGSVGARSGSFGAASQW